MAKISNATTSIEKHRQHAQVNVLHYFHIYNPQRLTQIWPLLKIINKDCFEKTSISDIFLNA